MSDVNPHLVVCKETTYGTYATSGAVALPCTTIQFEPGQEGEEVRATGAGRALQRYEATSMKPTFSFETNFWQEYMGRILRAALFGGITTTTPGGATNARLHGFRPLDTVLYGTSLELQHTAAFSEFERGAIIDTLDIAFDEEGLATVSASGMALDYCFTGRTFVTGAATPSITASPTYFATTVHPFVVHQAIIKTGGTVAYDATEGRLEVTGGTQYNVLKSFSLSISNGLAAVMTKHGYKTPYTIHDGARSINFSADISQLTLDSTWIAQWLNNTSQVIEVLVTGELIESGQSYEFGFVIPTFKLTTAPLQQETGAVDEPVSSIDGMALEGALGYDITFHIKDTQTAYS